MTLLKKKRNFTNQLLTSKNKIIGAKKHKKYVKVEKFRNLSTLKNKNNNFVASAFHVLKKSSNQIQCKKIFFRFFYKPANLTINVENDYNYLTIIIKIILALVPVQRAKIIRFLLKISVHARVLGRQIKLILDGYAYGEALRTKRF